MCLVHGSFHTTTTNHPSSQGGALDITIEKKKTMSVCEESSVPELVEESSIVIDEANGLSETTAGHPRIPIKYDDHGIGGETAESYVESLDFSPVVERFFRPLEEGDRIKCRYAYDKNRTPSKSIYLGEIHVTFERNGESLIPKRLLEGKNGVEGSPYKENETKHIVWHTDNFSLPHILQLIRDRLSINIRFEDPELIESATRSDDSGDPTEQMWLMYEEQCRFDLS